MVQRHFTGDPDQEHESRTGCFRPSQRSSHYQYKQLTKQRATCKIYIPHDLVCSNSQPEESNFKLSEHCSPIWSLGGSRRDIIDNLPAAANATRVAGRRSFADTLPGVPAAVLSQLKQSIEQRQGTHARGSARGGDQHSTALSILSSDTASTCLYSEVSGTCKSGYCASLYAISVHEHAKRSFSWLHAAAERRVCTCRTA